MNNCSGSLPVDKQVKILRAWLSDADAVVIGAGAGLSAAAGFTYGGRRFKENFADFERAYGFHDMYSGGFYPFPSRQHFWAYWSRMIMLNRYGAPADGLYSALLRAVKDKNYFVLTTNVDHRFQIAGFDKQRLFYTQGDYGLFRCEKPCHNKTYDNYAQVKAMAEEQKDLKIPSALVPRCPVCGGYMTTNLRIDDSFVQDAGWHAACARYKNFIAQNSGKCVLFLELGVGMNTPGIIKYPFIDMTYRNKKARYACINAEDNFALLEIEERSLCIKSDLNIICQLV